MTIPPLKPICSHCYWWKRKTKSRGMCWQWHAMVNEDDTWSCWVEFPEELK